jgi:DNA-binding transcriptional ArsR family regulator
MKKKAGVPGSDETASLDQLRALAHPLRLRMLELFTEGPRTTKQVAQLLGEPPTKLYHHANALERAGLLKLSKTRQNRGAVEKWYEVARNTVSGRQLSQSPLMQQAISGLATVALEQTRRDVELALRRPSGGHPLVIRMTVVGNEHRIVHIRERLLEVLRELCDQEGEEKQPGERDAQRWTLTVAFVPAAQARG